MAITINGKVYRNIQEQVEKNKDDIKILQDADETFATKTYVDGSIATVNTRIDNLLVAEDTDYKTELVFEPDDVYLNYYDKDIDDPQDYSFPLVQNMFKLDRLSNIHLYEHNIQLSVKLKEGGVTSNNFTGRVNLTLYSTSIEHFNETTLKQRIGRAASVIATGYAIHTVNEYNYTIIGLVKDSDQLSTDLRVDMIPTNMYASSGFVSSIIGEITSFIDNVVLIY